MHEKLPAVRITCGVLLNPIQLVPQFRAKVSKSLRALLDGSVEKKILIVVDLVPGGSNGCTEIQPSIHKLLMPPTVQASTEDSMKDARSCRMCGIDHEPSTRLDGTDEPHFTTYDWPRFPDHGAHHCCTHQLNC